MQQYKTSNKIARINTAVKVWKKKLKKKLGNSVKILYNSSQNRIILIIIQINTPNIKKGGDVTTLPFC